MVVNKIFYNILLFIIFIGLFSSCSYNNNQLPQKHSKYIMVKGNAVINVKPDTAILDLNIETTGKDIKTIQLKNNKSMDNLVDNLLKLGIDRKDIYRSNYNLNSDYGLNSKNKFEFLGYKVSSTISIKVKDINKIEEIITKSKKAGANIDKPIDFSVSDYDKYYKEALNSAIEDGNNKAKNISKKLGVDLGSAIKIDEYIDYNYIDNNTINCFKNSNPIEKSNSFRGENKLIEANVNMTFEY